MSFFHSVECDLKSCGESMPLIDAFTEWDDETCPVDDPSEVGKPVDKSDADYGQIVTIATTGWIMTNYSDTFCSRLHFWQWRDMRAAQQ